MLKRSFSCTVLLLCAAAALCIAASASAQMYYIFDDEAMSCCESWVGTYQVFDVLLLLEPGPDGAFGAEYLMSFPANIIQNPAPEPFPGISVAMGDAVGGAGISLGFETCQTELFVLYKFHAFPLSTTPGYIQVLPHPDTGIIAVATCEEPLRPTIEAGLYNYFGFHDWCGG